MKKREDWVTERAILRTIIREWFLDLSALERLAVLFVYDRTVGWGKTWERITMRQCAEGVWGEEGICYAAPFTSCKNRARTIMSHLVLRKVLLSRPSVTDGRSRVYALNLRWTPEPRRIPKRLEGVEPLLNWYMDAPSPEED